MNMKRTGFIAGVIIAGCCISTGFAALQPVSGRQTAGTKHLQVVFDFSRAKTSCLASLKFDSKGNGDFNSVPEILDPLPSSLYYYSQGDKVCGREGTELPRFTVKQEREDGTIWAVSYQGQGALRVYDLYYLPKGTEDVIAIRQMLRAMGPVNTGGMSLRLAHSRVFDEAAFLPGMSPRRTLADSVEKVDNTSTSAKIPDEGQAITLWGRQVSMTVIPVSPTPHDWQFRFTYMKDTSDPLGGMIHVEHDFGSVQAGQSCDMEFLLHFYSGQPEGEKDYIASAQLNELKGKAHTALMDAYREICSLEEKYRSEAEGVNITDDLETLKVNLVALQRAKSNLDLALEDTEIVKELGGTINEARLREPRRRQESASQFLEKSRQTINDIDSLSNRYQSAGAAVISEAHGRLKGLAKTAEQLARHALASAEQIRPKAAYNAPRMPAKIGPWPTDKLAGCLSMYSDGADSWRCELRKMKAAGMDWLEVGWWGYHFPVLYDDMKKDNRAKIIDLVRPVVEQGLDVEFHTFACSWGGEQFNKDVPGAIHTESRIPYDVTSPSWDYHMPKARQAVYDTFSWLGKVLKDNFGDKVFGFTHFCENRHWTMPTDYAREPFKVWLQKKYGAIDALNTAWKTGYADWEDLKKRVDLNALDTSGVAGASGDWRVFSLQAWADGVGEIYRGLSQSYPDKVCATRGTYVTKKWVAGKTCNVIGEHLRNPYHYEWQARATGLPWFNSEFWWGQYNTLTSIVAMYGPQAREWYQQFQESNGNYPSALGEYACWLTAASQLLDYSYLDCMGFNFFMFASGDFSSWMTNMEDRRTGLLRPSAARSIASVDELRRLRPLLLSTRNRARVAVLWCETEIATDPWHISHEAYPADMALADIHVDHDVVYEADVLGGRLGDYEVLWLPAAQRVPVAVQNKIAEWVKSGGKLVISGLFGAQDELCNPAPVLSKELGISFGEQVQVPNVSYAKLKLNLAISRANNGNPASKTRTPAWNEITWGTRPEKQFYAINGSPDSEILATYDTGQPVLIARNVGKGRVVASGYIVENLLNVWALSGSNAGDKVFPDRPEFIAGFRQVLDYMLQSVGYRKSYDLNFPAFTGPGTVLVNAVRRERASEPGYYLFLNNRGIRVGSDRGWPTELYLPEKASVTVTFAEPICEVKEVVRGVSLPVKKTASGTSVTFTMQSGRPYVLSVQP